MVEGVGLVLQVAEHPRPQVIENVLPGAGDENELHTVGQEMNHRNRHEGGSDDVNPIDLPLPRWPSRFRI